jgi:flagellar motor switch protein FliN
MSTPTPAHAVSAEVPVSVGVGVPAMASGPSYSGSGSSAAPSGEGPTVHKVQFGAFDNPTRAYGETNRNLDLVLDVTLNLTVELGRSELSIKEILELTRGSVVELDRIAGEPVDLLANGKLIAKGEVVVIEDSFGLRITSIVSPAERIKGLSQ